MTPRLQQLLQFQADRPNDAFILFALAKEYEKLGDTETALLHYQNIVQTTPDYVGVYYHLGKLLEKLEQPENAISAYKSGMVVANKLGDRHALSELAAAKMELSDDDD
ncbi:MAG: tetratricopeptide repeat protein [Saprospiraceae bacterium]|nr:tetratricopeptide repeat protein [Saprospiraceae bacterium]